MSQCIIAFTGISGVGKTTFLTKLADLVAFQHVTGGSLIAAAREAAPDERDAMRHSDLDENQRLLVRGFDVVRDSTAELIILDGHVVIDHGEGLTPISTDIFKALEVNVMVHLEAEPERIAKNRSLDTSRSRPVYKLETLSQHQNISRTHARSIAETLQIRFQVATHDGALNLAKVLTPDG